jgi:hypothetical protein
MFELLAAPLQAPADLQAAAASLKMGDPFAVVRNEPFAGWQTHESSCGMAHL